MGPRPRAPLNLRSRRSHDAFVLPVKWAAAAFLTHLLFLLLVLAISARSGTELYMYGDSTTYIDPASNLVHHGSFSREKTSPHVWEPYRTPGYPLLIAFFIFLKTDPATALALAPMFAALLAYSLVSLTYDIFGDRRAAGYAGLAAAFTRTTSFCSSLSNRLARHSPRGWGAHLGEFLPDTQ